MNGVINRMNEHEEPIDYTPDIWCSMASLCSVSCCESDLPEQVHLSVTGSPSQMVITWIQAQRSSRAYVTYYPTSLGIESAITNHDVTIDVCFQ